VRLCYVYVTSPVGGAITRGHAAGLALWAAYLTLHRRTNDCSPNDGVTADQFVLLAALAESSRIPLPGDREPP
jgi:hypothetical protein